MKFKEEALLEVVDEIKCLTKGHYDEVANFKDIPLDPNYEAYINMNNIGALRIYTARDTDSSLIGYAAFFISPSLQYQSSLQAVQDLIYLEKSKRGMGAGKEFIQWIDNELKKDGVQVVYHHTKVKHDFGPLLERVGYELTDKIYARRLDTCAEAAVL